MAEVMSSTEDAEGVDTTVAKREESESAGRKFTPSNEVHARVGNIVLRAARDGVRRGLRPEDIIRELVTEHDTRLTVGELRLLLASRPLPEMPRSREGAAKD